MVVCLQQADLAEIKNVMNDVGKEKQAAEAAAAEMPIEIDIPVVILALILRYGLVTIPRL